MDQNFTFFTDATQRDLQLPKNDLSFVNLRTFQFTVKELITKLAFSVYRMEVIWRKRANRLF